MEKSVVLERVYTVPLKRAWNSAYHKRTRKAVRMLKEFASRHMKSEIIKIDGELNKYIWRRGNANPPRKIKVLMIKYDNGEVLIKKYEEQISKKVSKEAKTQEKPEKQEKVKESEKNKKVSNTKETKPKKAQQRKNTSSKQEKEQ